MFVPPRQPAAPLSPPSPTALKQPKPAPLPSPPPMHTDLPSPAPDTPDVEMAEPESHHAQAHSFPPSPAETSTSGRASAAGLGLSAAGTFDQAFAAAWTQPHNESGRAAEGGPSRSSSSSNSSSKSNNSNSSSFFPSTAADDSPTQPPAQQTIASPQSSISLLPYAAASSISRSAPSSRSAGVPHRRTPSASLGLGLGPLPPPNNGQGWHGLMPRGHPGSPLRQEVTSASSSEESHFAGWEGFSSAASGQGSFSPPSSSSKGKEREREHKLTQSALALNTLPSRYHGHPHLTNAHAAAAASGSTGSTASSSSSFPLSHHQPSSRSPSIHDYLPLPLTAAQPHIPPGMPAHAAAALSEFYGADPSDRVTLALAGVKQSIDEGKMLVRKSSERRRDEVEEVDGEQGLRPFEDGLRRWVATVLDCLVRDVPLEGKNELRIVEYGSSRSHALPLIPDLIGHFASRHAASSPSPLYFNIIHQDAPSTDFRPLLRHLDDAESYLHHTSPLYSSLSPSTLRDTVFPVTAARPFGARIAPPRSVSVGFSLLDLSWPQEPYSSSSASSSSGNGSRRALTPDEQADEEMRTFLRARADEFDKGGLLVLAFITRSDLSRPGGAATPPRSATVDGSTTVVRTPGRDRSSSNDSTLLPPPYAPAASVAAASSRLMTRQRSDSTPQRPSPALLQSEPAEATSATPTPSLSDHTVPRLRRATGDIFTILTGVLSTSFQRLVSTGMIKADVARHLQALPVHPRTPVQARRLLDEAAGEWRIEWSCGLGPGLSSTSAGEVPPSEPALVLPHPAWKARQSGSLSAVAYAEHALALVKNLYSHQLREVLKERTRMGRSAIEFVLEEIMKVVEEKASEGALDGLEMEVASVALRRI